MAGTTPAKIEGGGSGQNRVGFGSAMPATICLIYHGTPRRSSGEKFQRTPKSLRDLGSVCLLVEILRPSVRDTNSLGRLFKLNISLTEVMTTVSGTYNNQADVRQVIRHATQSLAC